VTLPTDGPKVRWLESDTTHFRVADWPKPIADGLAVKLAIEGAVEFDPLVPLDPGLVEPDEPDAAELALVEVPLPPPPPPQAATITESATTSAVREIGRAVGRFGRGNKVVMDRLLRR